MPSHTTLENVHLYMKKKEYIPNIAVRRLQVKMKGETYKVEVWKDKSITCECSGFRYRKACKHTQAVQEKMNRAG